MSSWDGVAEAYRESFATLCQGTVERLLADTRGVRHLDVGSGTGSLAARAAATGRTVVALDSDPGMVGLSCGVVPGRVVAASIADLPFRDGTFDAATANFVINHVPDPRAAMGELARVLRPGGRAAMTIWPTQSPAWAALVSEAFTRAGVVSLEGRRLAAELEFDRSVEGLRGIAEAVGLEPLVATELAWEWEVPVDALWRGIAGGVATVGQTFLAQTPQIQAAAEREFRRTVDEFADQGMLRLPSVAVYVVAGWTHDSAPA